MPFVEVAVAWQIDPVAVLPPLFIGAIMVGKSRGGEKRGGEGEGDGLSFYVDSPSGGLADGEV